MEDLKPFQVRMVEGQVTACLPTNIQDLCNENYLYILYLKAIMALGFNVHYANDIYQGIWKINEDILSYLHGLGTPLALGEIPKFDPKYRGNYKRGLMAALEETTSRLPIDKRIYKFFDPKSPTTNEVLFGSVWATRFKTEVLVLNIIKQGLRETVTNGNLSTWIQSKEYVEQTLGLNISKFSKNKLLSNIEKQYLEEESSKLPSDSYEQIVQAPVREQRDVILKLQKNFRNLKNRLRSVLNDRNRTVFSKLSRAEKRRKLPVEELIDRAKHENYINYFNSFSPCGLFKITKFRVSILPDNSKNYNLAIDQFQKYWSKIEKNFPNFESSKYGIYTKQWYESTLGLFFVI
jgi:hypothetical protein